jgi:TetR/AcrR family transcriptional regulator
MRTARSPRRPRRRPGRPPRSRALDPGDAVRARLLRVAEQLFAERGYAAVSVRALARAAHVSPAMIAYYFRDKAGLLDAVLDDVFERLLAQLTALAAAPPDDAGGGAAERFIRLYVDTLARDPWLPSFMVREVLGGDPARRARFAARFPARIAPVVLPLLRREAASGRLRADLDPALTLLSVIGMCAFPFLVQPLLGAVLGYELDESFRERLADHAARLFLDGARGATP